MRSVVIFLIHFTFINLPLLSGGGFSTLSSPLRIISSWLSKSTGISSIWDAFIINRSSGLLSLGILILLLLLQLFNITVEEQIYRNIPVSITGNSSTKSEDFTGKEPVNKTDGVLSLVVGRDGNIYMLKRRV